MKKKTFENEIIVFVHGKSNLDEPLWKLLRDN